MKGTFNEIPKLLGPHMKWMNRYSILLGILYQEFENLLWTPCDFLIHGISMTIIISPMREREGEREKSDRSEKLEREKLNNWLRLLLPACLGRALQLSWPFFWMKVISLKSSAGLQGPLFTLFLSQHGVLPFPISLPLSLSLNVSLRLPHYSLTYDVFSHMRNSLMHHSLHRIYREGVIVIDVQECL